MTDSAVTAIRTWKNRVSVRKEIGAGRSRDMMMGSSRAEMTQFSEGRSSVTLLTEKMSERSRRL